MLLGDVGQAEAGLGRGAVSPDQLSGLVVDRRTRGQERDSQIQTTQLHLTTSCSLVRLDPGDENGQGQSLLLFCRYFYFVKYSNLKV